MAYLQDENDAPGVAAAPGKAGVGGAAGGGGAFIGGGGQGATTTAPGSAAPTAPAGGYTNLLSYIGANQSGGAATGQAAENVVQQSADTAGKAQADYSSGGQADIAKGAAGTGIDAATEAKIKAGGVGVDPAQEAKIKAGIATTDPAKMAAIAAGGNSTTGAYTGPDAPDTTYAAPSAYTAQYGGPGLGDVSVSYGGPTGTEGFTGNTAAAKTAAVGAGEQTAANAKNAAGGQAGVAGLLRSAYQNPNYSQGENSLDAFLAGGTSGGQAALGQAAGVNARTQSGYTGINDLLSGKIKGATDQAAVTNNQYRNDIQAAQGQTDITNAKYASELKAAQGDTTAKDAYAKAIADAKAKAGAYVAPVAAPPPPSGDNTNPLAPEAAAIGSVAKAGKQIADLPKDTSPGQVSHQGIGGSPGAQQAGAPITSGNAVTNPGAFKPVIDAVKAPIKPAAQAAKTIAHVIKKPKF